MWTNPESLISASRLDVFARVDLVRAQLLNQSGLWGRTLYQNYLVATGANGRMFENGTKASVSDYFLEFCQLIQSMKKHGFLEELGAIPVTAEGITNGAHRLATALQLSLPVFVSATQEPFSDYDYRFMQKRQVARVFIDKMALNLLRACRHSRAVLIFGESRKTVDAIEGEVRKTAGVAIRTRLQLTEIGKRRVVQLAYDHNVWWNRSKLLEKMTSERFDSGPSHCDLIFTLEKDLSTLNARKQHLRSMLPTNHFERRVHGTDHHFDTMFLAEFALNSNSRLFVNSSPIGSEDRIIRILGDLVPESDSSMTELDWCVDGSSVLELFGLRQANDLDYVVCEGSRATAALRKAGSDHSKEYIHGFADPFEIIEDPRNHLIYKGLKFISPSALMCHKFHRPDPQSKIDMAHLAGIDDRESGTYMSINLEVTGLISRLSYRVIAFSDRLLRRLPPRVERFLRQKIADLRRRL